jgi:hypothetical protein
MYAQGDAGHPALHDGGQEKNYQIKMQGQGTGEPQGVAYPPPPKKKTREEILNVDMSCS